MRSDRLRDALLAVHEVCSRPVGSALDAAANVSEARCIVECALFDGPLSPEERNAIRARHAHARERDARDRLEALDGLARKGPATPAVVNLAGTAAVRYHALRDGAR